MIGFQLSDNARVRLRKLLDRSEYARSWKPIALLIPSTDDDAPIVLQASPDQWDAVACVVQFLHAWERVPDEIYDHTWDVLLAKIAQKGGQRCDPAQVQDVFYEGQVRMLLADCRLPGVELVEEDSEHSDLAFTVRFGAGQNTQEDFMQEVFLECKNVRNGSQSLPDLVRRVADCVKGAVGQHRNRLRSTDSLIVFVDLPLEIGSDEERYPALVVNMWRQLWLEGLADPNLFQEERTEVKESDHLDLAQVFFTSTYRTNMHDYLAEDASMASALTLKRPLVFGPDTYWCSPVRAVFLSYLFAEESGRLNIDNFAGVARTIDPDRFPLP